MLSLKINTDPVAKIRNLDQKVWNFQQFKLKTGTHFSKYGIQILFWLESLELENWWNPEMEFEIGLKPTKELGKGSEKLGEFGERKRLSEEWKLEP